MPRTPSPLESLLDDEQKERLCNFIDTTAEAVRGQLTTFREKRKKFQRQMDDDFEWRRGATGRTPYNSNSFDEWARTVFDFSNDSLNIVGGFAAFMTARSIDDVFGTEPYYTAFPEGASDNVLADSIQKHSEWKLRQSNWKDAACDAIESAIGLGEGVIKQTWVRDIDISERRTTLWFDRAAGRPVLTVDGSYVEATDNVAIQPEMVNGRAAMVMRVEKDPTLVLDVNQLEQRQMEVEQVNVTYNNVKAAVMHYGDFLCAENAPDINDTNFVAHETQLRLSELREKYNLDDETAALFRNDSNNDKTESAKPIDHLGEQPISRLHLETEDPIVKLLEAWVKFDPVGDGRQRRMYCLYAPEHRVMVEMDYIANRTPEGKLPFQVIRAFKVKNRWYGRGYFEIYEKAQEFIDRHLNYVAYRNRFHSNPAVFFDQSQLVEGEDGEEFELIPGKTYRLKPGVKVEDVIQAFSLPDLDERTWQLMQMMIQVVQVRSGVTSAAQGEVSSLPSTATATGIESILQSASTLARQPINLLKHGLEAALLYAVKLIYSNMDGREVFTYFEGDQSAVGALDALSVKDLELNVRLLLTRFRQREAVESSEKAIAYMEKYIAWPEQEKGPVRPLFIQALKGLGFDQANTIVRQPMRPVTDPRTGQPMLDPTTGQPMMQQPGGAPALPAPQQIAA